LKSSSRLINIGYYIRCRAVDAVLKKVGCGSYHHHLDSDVPGSKTQFLQRYKDRKVAIVNLGCGYDPTFFRLANTPSLPCKLVYIDVDYPALIQRKTAIISNSEKLRNVLPRFEASAGGISGGKTEAGHAYVALGCDLKDREALKKGLESLGLGQMRGRLQETAVLFVSEVSHLLYCF
jgi:tRNA wybutosine-synthesizing protein 4